MTEQEFRARIEQPHGRRMYGQWYEVHPRLVSEKFGDGRKLIGLAPIMTRPQYYVVRIDSRWTIDNRKPGPCLYDHLDEIYEAIEDEYGYAFEDDEEAGEAPPWPALRPGGSSWGLIRWRDLLEPLPPVPPVLATAAEGDGS